MPVEPRPAGIVAPAHLRLGLARALPWALAILGGCTGIKTIVDPLNVLGGAKPPIRVGVTTLDLAPPLLMLPKRELFNLAMADYLKEQVHFELLTPRQIRVHLGTGRMAFAMLRPVDYARMTPTDTCEVLAMPLNLEGQPYRQGLIVTAPKSAITRLGDARSVRVHFMPDGNPLNTALIGAMVQAGIPKERIDKGILGLGLDTHHISSLEVAKSVVLEEKAVGVIDQADYDKWPKTGGSFVLLAPSQDQVRVIGKTPRTPEGYFVVSTKVPSELKKQLEEFLFTVAPKHHKLALASMDVTGYSRPSDQQSYEDYHRLIRGMYGSDTPPPSSSETPASQPAKAGS
ncbi:MAG TPA: PhnD/SsuA/transferrin family substrate-binding protein [Phycisphaerae bacterium]|nr:PhnD/SsuA/transferrin family substrate-binding protein [Phycisphaerae bacterium]HRY67085.1 PhnD/SsuA/transferrin family substrate-binding protein [Phycisphaerae bacterium]HSA26546.1 PhnD/SsuA/transferrin family substrate-binding protein [Phycisphaerae bacterium]